MSIDCAKWMKRAERVLEYLVGLCYGLTAGVVVLLLANGVRDGWRAIEDGQSASDRYAESPGFDPREVKRAMQRTLEAMQGRLLK